MSNDGRVHFGVVRVDLHLPGVDSLKAKRARLNRAKAALQRELSCSVAEVGGQDLWQVATLGVAVAASSATGVRRVVERVTGVLERDPQVIVTGSAATIDALDEDEAEPGWGIERRG